MIDASQLLQYALELAMVMLRVLGLWMFFPIFGRAGIPNLVKVSGGVALSMALMPSVLPLLPQWNIQKLPDNYEIFSLVLREAAIGAGMGLMVRWIFTSCLAGAHWAGTQMGFSMGSMFDPEFGTQDSSWADFNNWSFVMT